MSSNSTTTDQLDVRGPRFVAWITTAVLVTTLIVAGISIPAAAVILSVQAVAFAIGAWAGPRRHPYGVVFANLVAPRLGPVREREPVAPLKFAQLVGFAFAALGVAGFAAGVPLLGIVATGAALAAAFLNAAFGICLGCHLYPLVARLRNQPKGSTPWHAPTS
jgi:hypothetical protein